MSGNRINIVNIILIIVFLALTVIGAGGAFFLVRYVVTTQQTFKMPGVVINEAQVQSNTPKPGETVISSSNAVPTSIPQVDAVADWNGASRVTLLLLGLDARDWEANEGPPRSDTMILVTIDLVSRTSGMLSIPRDLWVNIPGYDYGRINTAYQLGEAYKVPGGGPALAAKTVEAVLGVPIQYYAQVDFDTFVQFIDAIGGVKVNVPQTIKVDLMGNEPLINKKKGNQDLGDKTVKTLKPGWQMLDGLTALAYARERHTEGGDFDRAQRQQQIILAIRDRMWQFNRLGTLLTDMPKLYQQLSSGIHTNLTFDEVLQLGWAAKDIWLTGSEKNVTTEQMLHGIIGKDQVVFASSPDGTQSVLKPRPEEIRTVRDRVFTVSQSKSQIAAAGLEYAVQAEHAKIAVQNGTAGSDQAAKAGQYLQSLGLNVVQTGDAAQAASVTTIIDYTGNPYTIRYLQQWFNLNTRMLKSEFNLNSPVDIALVIGNDYHQP